ncbi:MULTISPECIES: DUF1223 domain-containing protein [Pseudophaeobacter]|jgi:hypothetical protein|uniref:DUF1223 domain-containing protein n=1 Tax=Pseudophaeobacter TaxID=1541822 RepID=UPI00242B9C6A|nr:DUF1223 domain-containing protein [Pseudophaeobacter profundi]
MKSLAALAALALAIGLALPAQAQAEETGVSVSEPVVVELFTSQGCSSCPPADALLEQLAGRRDVLALALHVDYWDYIGWKDIFASPDYTQRQKGYAHAAGRKMIYTPQMVVMGQKDILGGDAMALSDAIAVQHGTARPVALQVQRRGDELSLSVSAREGLPDHPVAIYVLRYTPMKTVDITRGELAGRRIDYANIVEDLRQVATWDGQAAAVFTVPYAKGLPGAVLVQNAPYGAVLAAAGIAQ